MKLFRSVMTPKPAPLGFFSENSSILEKTGFPYLNGPFSYLLVMILVIMMMIMAVKVVKLMQMIMTKASLTMGSELNHPPKWRLLLLPVSQLRLPPLLFATLCTALQCDTDHCTDTEYCCNVHVLNLLLHCSTVPVQPNASLSRKLCSVT